MKKFLIVGSSLAPVFCAATAGAVDITLGGSIDMGVEFGLGKNNSDLSVQGGYNEVTLSISAAHTTDGGLAFGGAFGLSTSAEIEFDPYADAAGDKYPAKRTVDGRTDVAANLWNVSGGGAVDDGRHHHQATAPAATIRSTATAAPTRRRRPPGGQAAKRGTRHGRDGRASALPPQAAVPAR